MRYDEIIAKWKEKPEIWSVNPRKMTAYEKRKIMLRDMAIQWQYECPHEEYDWWDYLECTEFFEAQGRKYGLLREFRENGIC